MLSPPGCPPHCHDTAPIFTEVDWVVSHSKVYSRGRSAHPSPVHAMWSHWDEGCLLVCYLGLLWDTTAECSSIWATPKLSCPRKTKLFRVTANCLLSLLHVVSSWPLAGWQDFLVLQTWWVIVQSWVSLAGDQTLHIPKPGSFWLLRNNLWVSGISYLLSLSLLISVNLGPWAMPNSLSMMWLMVGNLGHTVSEGLRSVIRHSMPMWSINILDNKACFGWASLVGNTLCVLALIPGRISPGLCPMHLLLFWF